MLLQAGATVIAKKGEWRKEQHRVHREVGSEREGEHRRERCTDYSLRDCLEDSASGEHACGTTQTCCNRERVEQISKTCQRFSTSKVMETNAAAIAELLHLLAFLGEV